jgi:hypothetical protein
VDPPDTNVYVYAPVPVETAAVPVSTTPAGPFVVTTTAVFELAGAGVTVPVTWIVACPEYVDELVAAVTVTPAANASVGPKTSTAASRTAAMVLSVFISITW